MTSHAQVSVTRLPPQGVQWKLRLSGSFPIKTSSVHLTWVGHSIRKVFREKCSDFDTNVNLLGL